MQHHSTIVVTGGSKGLGFAIVKALIGGGYRVIVLSRTEGMLSEMDNADRESVIWLQMDLTSNESVTSAVNKIAELTDSIDGLVLNAALTTPRRFEDITEGDLDLNLSANVVGPLLCLQKLIPLLAGSRAVFLSSESVERPAPMLALYAGVKAAMETVISGIRRELFEDHGIRLSVLRAGSMEGTAFGESWTEEQIHQFYKVAEDTGFLGSTGAPMPPEQVASGVVQILEMPKESSVHLMDIRSASAF
jgi:NAD(P)-dependent dehydrogenase (short-subunit alcohol dehydrogenase family)